MRGGSDAQIRIMRGKNVLTSEWGPKKAMVRDKKTGEDEDMQVNKGDVMAGAVATAKTWTPEQNVDENMRVSEKNNQIKAACYPWRKGEIADSKKSDYRSVTLTMGKKDSKGKLDWSLLPYESLTGVVRVMEKGSVKYGGHRTWLPGIMFSRLFAAIMRHLIDWFVFVKDKDKESGEHPLCHVIANCMMLLTYINDKTFDDR